MAEGDKEIILASEEVQRKNLLTAIEHTNETRKMVLELHAIIEALQNQVIAQNKQYELMRTQLAALQQQFYSKGTVNFNDGQ